MPNNVRWTPDQEKAIEARGGTLIVSAAAGSGKTAVLVERCIRRLLDETHPCNADELLIVTFTRAATAEMRTRLSKAISDKLLEDPDNEHLQTQQMLLPSAHICTIDSFCGNLVRENFEQLGISPDFRMLDETEEKVLQQNAMDQVLEELYTEQDPAFTRLVELLATGRDDTSIEANIRRLHTYSRAYPSPKHWLETGLSLFDDPTEAYQIMKASLREALDSWVLRWANVVRLLETEQGHSDLDYAGTLESVKGYIAQTEELKELVEAEDWAAFRDAVPSLPIAALKKPSLPKGETTAVLELAKKLKKSFTPAKLKDEFAKYPITPPEDTAVDSRVLKPLAEKLVAAVLRFDAVYSDLKREENALDFADTELMALQLLVEDPAAEPFRRNELAEALRQQFKEILIDEYQDTNKLQDTIFAALSQDDLFMVGDVKQSIYRFRQAMPELFLRKKEAYDLYDPEKNEYPATVILGKNFRSREGILRAVNYTFSRLMSRAVGEISYDRTEWLNYGAEDYAAREEPDVEFHIVVPEAGANRQEAEAAHIARYIAESIRNSQGTDHALNYKDFAILMRAPGTTAAVWRKVLTEAGIPVYAETGNGFLDTPEVMTVLSLLSVIDNPVQDVPLLSVLLSPLFGFKEDEVASLRVNSRKGSLYQAVLKGEEDGNAHCAQFLAELRNFRTLSLSMGAGELLRRIYEDTAYDTIVGAMNVGEQRVANLQMLLHYADSYDANSSYGAAGFVRYMDRLREQDGSLNVAATLSPNANVVHIMSIHKSKGLEFPVCIVADLKHQFNDGELNKGLILHPELGIGLKGRQPDTGFTYPTLIHSAMKEATLRSERSESLRLLYVAMTRAREKLVLSACDAPRKNDKDPDALANTLKNIAARLYGGNAVPPMEVLRTNTFYHWCLLAFLQHPDAALLRARAADSAVDLLPVLEPEETFPMTFVIDNCDGEAEMTERTEAPEAPAADPAVVQTLRERMTYVYPYAELSSTLSKRSASHLGEKPFSTEYFAETRPESLSKNGMTPAERGTCLHKFMQYADFDRAAEDPAEETARLVRDGFLLEEEASVVDPGKVRAFFASDIAARMKKSPRVLREHKFAILLPAGKFDEQLTAPLSEEKVLIQGIIDCAFEEDGQMVLLDYKTDRVVNGEDLAARYRDQLDLYRVALEETLGLPVREVCLYSFALGETVPL